MFASFFYQLVTIVALSATVRANSVVVCANLTLVETRLLDPWSSSSAELCADDDGEIMSAPRANGLSTILPNVWCAQGYGVRDQQLHLWSQRLSLPAQSPLALPDVVDCLQQRAFCPLSLSLTAAEAALSPRLERACQRTLYHHWSQARLVLVVRPSSPSACALWSEAWARTYGDCLASSPLRLLSLGWGQGRTEVPVETPAEATAISRPSESDRVPDNRFDFDKVFEKVPLPIRLLTVMVVMILFFAALGLKKR